MYRDHQIQACKLPEEACGGKYLRYTLRDYFPKLGQHDWIPGLGPLQEPELEHGALIAALRRAFQVVGDPLVGGIPDECRQSLRELQDLYMKPVQQTNPAAEANIREDNEPSSEDGSGDAPNTGSSADPNTTLPADGLGRGGAYIVKGGSGRQGNVEDDSQNLASQPSRQPWKPSRSDRLPKRRLNSKPVQQLGDGGLHRRARTSQSGIQPCGLIDTGMVRADSTRQKHTQKFRRGLSHARSQRFPVCGYLRQRRCLIF